MSGRKIAPRPVLQPGVASSASIPPAGIDEPQSSSSQTQNTATVSSRKKVTSACQGCQRRRVKCDGNLPCATCVRTKSECSYQPDLDGRSIKRKYHEVQRDQEFLVDLIRSLKYSEDENVSKIVSVIRSGASLEEIKACVVQQLNDIHLAGRERSPQFQQLQSNLGLLTSEARERARSAQRPAFLEIQRLADQPLYRLSASPWTNVTDDDDLVSNLISVWLTWDKGWYDWIDEDLFIRDMKMGSLDATFCSPFLVNTLLAWACPYSDYKEARTANGAVSQLMMDFIDEAKRLLESEPVNGLCLTTIQGSMFLHAALAASGHDQVGYRYVFQAIGMLSELIASPLAIRPHPDPQIAKEISGNIDRTCWGVYGVTAHTSSALLKPTSMEVPRRARPGQNALGFAPRQWRAYPYKDDALPFHRDELFEFGCDVAVLESELSRTLFNMQEQLPRKQLERKILGIYESLQQRVRQLPDYLDPTMGCCPALYANRGRIETVTLRIFLSLRQPDLDASPDIVEMARARCLESALEVSRLCKIHVESWGASALGLMMCQPITVGLSVLLEESDRSTYSAQITEMCVALRAMSRRWPLCMGMLRMIQLDARMKGWVLPPETDKLFEEFEGYAWRLRETKRYFTLYPAADTFKTTNLTGDELDMGKFLEMMEKLELDDATD